MFSCIWQWILFQEVFMNLNIYEIQSGAREIKDKILKQMMRAWVWEIWPRTDKCSYHKKDDGFFVRKGQIAYKHGCKVQSIEGKSRNGDPSFHRERRSCLRRTAEEKRGEEWDSRTPGLSELHMFIYQLRLMRSKGEISRERSGFIE